MNEVSPSELRLWMEMKERIQLVDVREPHEWELGCLDGASLFPLGQLEAAFHEGGLDASLKTVVYCHHGVRSAMACHFFAAQGFKNLYNLTGGIDQWAVDVDPQIKRY